MRIARGDVSLFATCDGAKDAPAIIFAHSLGGTMHLWDDVLPHLTDGLRVIRYDLRGHGQSDIGQGPYSMGQLISDAEAVCESFAVRDGLFVGMSVGGLVAQGLAIKRPDLVRAMVLSNTAVRIGHAQMWQERIDAVNANGMAMMADQILPRWFGRDFYGTPAMDRWRDMLRTTPRAGYVATCAAIAGTDFYTPTSGLRLPTLGIAGSEDKTTPPDLVRETVDLIPGSQFALMRRVGHLPPAEKPQDYAKLLNRFIADTGHLLPLAK